MFNVIINDISKVTEKVCVYWVFTFFWSVLLEPIYNIPFSILVLAKWKLKLHVKPGILVYHFCVWVCLYWNSWKVKSYVIVQLLLHFLDLVDFITFWIYMFSLPLIFNNLKIQESKIPSLIWAQSSYLEIGIANCEYKCTTRESEDLNL